MVAFDPYTNEVRFKELKDMKEKILRQRYAAIARSKDAEIFGIIVGTKKGQERMDLAIKIKDLLKDNDKKYYFLTLDFFSSHVLEGFIGIDCFVSTACPRIAIDDYLSYKKPVITPVELEVLLGTRKWDDYLSLIHI